MPVRIEVIRSLNNASQHSALGHIQLLHILAEVGLCRLTKPIDRETTLLPKVDPVGIHLKDLLLVKSMLKLESNHDLHQLVPDRAIVRQKNQLSQLHRDSRGAPAMLAIPNQIMPASSPCCRS